MISEGLRETGDWSNDAANSVLHTFLKNVITFHNMIVFTVF